MKKTAEKQPARRVSDAAVEARTGKNWSEWFTILDKAGARKMNHTEMASYLYERHGLDGWWAQMVSVTYEQDRGIRDRHQKPSGYEISRGKTIAAPVSKVFEAWNDKKLRDRWLTGATVVVRKATPDKSMRITWDGGKSSLSVYFSSKGDSKSQVVVQHGKLPNAKEAERMKTYWQEKLELLQEAIS